MAERLRAVQLSCTAVTANPRWQHRRTRMTVKLDALYVTLVLPSLKLPGCAAALTIICGGADE